MSEPRELRWALSSAVVALAFWSLAVEATTPDPNVGGPTEAPAVPSLDDLQSGLRGDAAQAVAGAQGAVTDARPQADPSHGTQGAQNPGPQDPGPQNPGPQAVALPPRVEQTVDETLDPVRATADAVLGLARETADRAREIPERLFGSPQPQEDAPIAAAPASTGAAPAGASLLASTLLIAAGAATAATFLGFWLAGSSGAIGGKAAAAKAGELGRLLPFASPLFTRFERDTVLGHPRREAIYALILQQPGISLQAIGDATGLSRTAVIHHLRLMEQQHLVVSRRVGRSRHYFENGGRYGHDQKEAYALLQNPRSKEVADYIRSHPGSMQKALCQALGIQPSIAHWHVRRLEEARIVESVRRGRTVAYFPAQAMQALGASTAAPAPVAPAA